jgi:hypothetical protein
MNLKQYISILLIALIGGIIGGGLSMKLLWKPEKVLSAEKFRVVGESGNVLATFGRGKDHNAYLNIVANNDNGKSIMSLTGNGISMMGRGVVAGFGTAGISLSWLADVPVVKNGETLPEGFKGAGTALSLTLSKNGSPQIILGNKRNPYLSLKSSRDGEPQIVLGSEDDPRTIIGYTKLRKRKSGDVIIKSSSSIVMFDKNGNIIWSAP